MEAFSEFSPEKKRRLLWFREVKFGLFIHWGAYSAAGVEASWPVMAPDLSEAMFNTDIRISEAEYCRLPSAFNPVDFNAEEWVRIAKDAGMRYIVFTSKHHDGFCMFDAPGTDYKITNTEYKKDICLELSNACRKLEMPLGFYYSPPDMHHPGYRNTKKPVDRNWTGEPERKEWRDYLDYMESHIRKLLTDYGQVKILWFDGLANHGKYDPSRFHKLIRELSPDTLINDRLGGGFDYITPEQFIPESGIPAVTGKPTAGLDPDGDKFFRLICFLFKIPLIRMWIRKQMRKYAEGNLELTPVHQEEYPSPERFQPWETCMTMGQSWGFNPKETNWKPPETLIQNLTAVAGRGGNYLLNVGPAGSGIFPPEAVMRLQSVGKWMKKYGDSIYGTTYTPLHSKNWGQATYKDNEVFLHIVKWPENSKLEIDFFPAEALSVTMFEGDLLDFSQDNRKLGISLPLHPPDPAVSVITVTINGSDRSWRDYSPPVIDKIEPKKYIKNQAISCGIINSVLNLIIAFFTYRSSGSIPFAEAAADIFITTAIITFLNAWILIGSARKEYAKGNIKKAVFTRRRLKLPEKPTLRALIIMFINVILFGGIVTSGLIYLVSPGGLGNWTYIIIKTLYTGTAAMIAAAVSVKSVINDEYQP